MESIRALSRPTLWLMFGIVLVTLNLRPSMAAVGPLLKAIHGDIPLSRSLAADCWDDRDQLGSFEWAWWSLTGVRALMLLMVLRFNPRHYAHHLH